MMADKPTTKTGGGFRAETMPGAYYIVDDAFPGATHVYTFHADGSGVADWADDPVNDGFTWFVDAEGRLLVDLARLSGLPDELTLVDGVPENGRIAGRFDDDSNGIYEGEAGISIVKR